MRFIAQDGSVQVAAHTHRDVPYRMKYVAQNGTVQDVKFIAGNFESAVDYATDEQNGYCPRQIISLEATEDAVLSYWIERL